MRKSWLVICLFNFVVAALMGLFLRLTKVVAVDIEYSHLLHAHSHTAMLGWAYMMVFALAVHYFVPEGQRAKYNRLFWITQTTVIGMMVAFPLQGYGPFSITFSTLHIICSYWFAVKIYRDTRHLQGAGKKLFHTGLFFMAFSTLGAWALGPIGALIGKDSPMYRSAIQFFLHFQFNGWFLAAALAMFLAHFVDQAQSRKFRAFHSMLILSIVLTFGLPLSWNLEHQIFFHMNWIGALLQASAMIVFWLMFRNVIRERALALPSEQKMLLALAVVSILLKILLQVLAVSAAVADASHKFRDFAIGFIHLTMLGAVTGFLLMLIPDNLRGSRNRIWTIGVRVFCTGFIATEGLLFARGIREWMNLQPYWPEPEMLFAASVLLPSALIAMLLWVVKNRAI